MMSSYLNLINWSLGLQVSKYLSDIFTILSRDSTFPNSSINFQTNHYFLDLNLCLHPDRLKKLWKIMVRQLNLGDTSLKRSTLDLMTIMLKENSTPSATVSSDENFRI